MAFSGVTACVFCGVACGINSVYGVACVRFVSVVVWEVASQHDSKMETFSGVMPQCEGIW